MRLQLQADQDTLTQNNSAGAYVIVQGPPKILVVEGTPGEGKYLVDALRAMAPEQRAPSSSPLQGERALTPSPLVGEGRGEGSHDDRPRSGAPPLTFPSLRDGPFPLPQGERGFVQARAAALTSRPKSCRRTLSSGTLTMDSSLSASGSSAFAMSM